MLKEFHWAKIDLLKTINEFMPEKSVSKAPPRFTIIRGGPAAGKTAYRRGKYASHSVTLDAGDIFLSLTGGRNLPFPNTALEFEVNTVGYSLLWAAIRDNRNVVCEISPVPYGEYAPYTRMIKELGFTLVEEWLECDQASVLIRNAYREEAFIPSIYTDRYHLNWIRMAHTQVWNGD